MKAFQSTLALCIVLAACSGNKTSQTSVSETPGGGSTAPSGRDAATEKKALVRFAQTIPGKERVDLWFGDMKVFSEVAYKEVTPYIEVPAGRDEFKVQNSGDTQTTALATHSEGLTAGGRYTIVAERNSPNDAAATLDALSDELTPPSPGKTKVRFVNTAVGLGKVDVFGPDGKIVGGVGEDSSTSYKEAATTSGTLEIRRSDKQVDVLRINNVNLQPGLLYTIFIVGGVGSPLEAIPVADRLVPPTGVGG